MLKIIDYLLLILYCGIIYWLSDQQTLPAPDWFNFQDKLHHAIAYAVMAYFAWRSLRHSINKPIILGLTIIVFSSLYGASDEWHQSFVIGRNSSVGDWVADTLGALCMVFVIFKWELFRPKNSA